VTLFGVLWLPRRRRAIESASGGPSAAAERLPAVAVGARELWLPPRSSPPPGGARRSSDRLRTRGVLLLVFIDTYVTNSKDAKKPIPKIYEQ